MNIENLIQDYKHLINRDLKSIYINGPNSLVKTFDYVINSNGKRIRPLLVLLSTKICKGDINVALPAAASLELLHNFTLVHDDVMDNDQLRRGIKTVHEKWDLGTAILSGDLILSIALKNLINSYPDNHSIIKIFTDGLVAVCEGQALDKEFEGEKIVKVDDYLNMIDLKTGYLIGMCTEIGAKLSNADSITCSKLKEYGLLLGRGFQIQDDYLEIFSDTKVMGKSLQSDILLNKKTFLMILAKQKSPQEVKEAILLSKENFDLGINDIRKIIIEEGIKEYTKNMIVEIFSKANLLLEEIKYQSNEIRFFTDYLLNRKK